MPRKKGQVYASDAVYNARRRYARAAAKYEKQAAKATGIEANRLRALARTSLEKANALYDDPGKAQQSSLIQGLNQMLNPRERKNKLSNREKRKLVNTSLLSTKKFQDRDRELMKEEETRALLDSDAGSRLYAGLIDIWGDSDYEQRDQAIMDFFGVQNMSDVLETIADAGIDLYADAYDYWRYEEIRTALELKFVA